MIESIKRFRRARASKKIKSQGKVAFTGLLHKETALHSFSDNQVIFSILILLSLLLGLIFRTQGTLILLVSTITVIYFFDLLFQLTMIWRSFSANSEISVSKKELVQEIDWPVYTVFCPLYKEARVLPQFIKAMENLDYPKEKLEVLLLLEEDDKETIENARKYGLPSYFKILVVPDSAPKTKPKATNYGLLYATGEYVVIYDAEDIPETDQLKKSVLAFRKINDDSIACLQAKLNFYNPRQNILTRLFTAEYSLWFDLVLTGLQSLRGPLPLGGTSNHFRRIDLIELQGWDPYNVTEDCDLGIRLYKRGFSTAVLDSTTWEEANSDLKNWIRQRSRWLKGYMQTYLVHMKDPRKLLTFENKFHVITFQLTVGGKIASVLINPLMWAITVIYILFRAKYGAAIESIFPSFIFYMAVTSLFIGNFLYLYYYVVGLAKRGYWDIIKYAFFVPFYWLLISYAAGIALYQLIVKPHYWEKTVHGLHLQKKKSSRTLLPMNLFSLPFSYEKK